MDESAANTPGTSLLLWLVAAAVALLTAHVCLAWVRAAQPGPVQQARWKAVTWACASAGSGLAGTMVLALTAEELAFPIGYPLLWVLVLWIGPMLASAPAFAALVRSTSVGACVGAGAWLAAVAGATSAGWLWAAGLRPGVVWQPEYIAAMAFVLLLGCSIALLVAFGEAARKGQRRRLWRLCGAMLLATSLLVGEQMLLLSAALPVQISSLHQDAVSGYVLSLIGGVLLPMGMTAMAFDLELRRRLRWRRSSHKADAGTPRPRRHRRR